MISTLYFLSPKSTIASVCWSEVVATWFSGKTSLANLEIMDVFPDGSPKTTIYFCQTCLFFVCVLFAIRLYNIQKDTLVMLASMAGSFRVLSASWGTNLGPRREAM